MFQGPQTVTRVSPRSVSETVSRFLDIARTKNVQIFSVIDQRAEALSVGMELRETTLIIFGDPRAGTPVMQAEPLAALDLPLKLLIWAGDDATNVSYVSPPALAARYDLSDDLAHRLAAIDVLAEELVTP
ncbi:MAG TPA: DUF302 domain-containing protein [Acidimicrobiales bacterium]|nr:DUF302 domain-containing protein [Acidimicrobiales bacterium]